MCVQVQVRLKGKGLSQFSEQRQNIDCLRTRERMDQSDYNQIFGLQPFLCDEEIYVRRQTNEKDTSMSELAGLNF